MVQGVGCKIAQIVIEVQVEALSTAASPQCKRDPLSEESSGKEELAATLEPGASHASKVIHQEHIRFMS